VVILRFRGVFSRFCLWAAVCWFLFVVVPCWFCLAVLVSALFVWGGCLWFFFGRCEGGFVEVIFFCFFFVCFRAGGLFCSFFGCYLVGGLGG